MSNDTKLYTLDELLTQVTYELDHVKTLSPDSIETGVRFLAFLQRTKEAFPGLRVQSLTLEDWYQQVRSYDDFVELDRPLIWKP